VEVPPDLPPLFAVRDQIVQVFLNLILNAMDATDKNGRIEIRARHDGNRLKVSVHDDGHGIPPGQALKLFQPYFTTKRHGTGLGLFVTRKMVADHNGEVTFASAPGEGAVFEVVLPIG
jgi:signal transduction histidine kinase